MANNFFQKLNFTKCLNRNDKIVFIKFEGNSLARRRSILLIFPIFIHLSVFFSPRTASTQPNLKTNV